MGVSVRDGIAADDNASLEFSLGFANRQRMYFADPRIAGRVWVSSGSRTYAEQEYLRNGYVNGLPGFNLAADPDAVQGYCAWSDPPFTGRGSWHMVQDGPDGNPGGGAADLSWSGISTYDMQQIAREYGMGFPVVGENWHAQAYTTNGWYPGPDPYGGLPVVPDEMAMDPLEMLVNSERNRVLAIAPCTGGKVLYLSTLQWPDWSHWVIGKGLLEHAIARGTTVSDGDIALWAREVPEERRFEELFYL